MNFIYIILIVLVAQQVSAERVGFLEPFFNNPHWNVSLAVTAPIISPEETKQHLEALLPLLPPVKEEYTIWRLKDNANRSRAEDLIIVHDDLKSLVELEKLSDRYKCWYNDFLKLYDFDNHPNVFGDPEKNTDFGPNMRVYIAHYRKKMFETCKNALTENYGDIKPRHQKVIDAITKVIIDEAKLDDPRDVAKKVDNKLITNSFVKYMKTNTDGKKETIKEHYGKIKDACREVDKEARPRDMIDYFFTTKDLSNAIIEDENFRNLSIKIKICLLVNVATKQRSVELDDILDVIGF